MDPTNNVVPSNGHVTLAWGRDYGDVSPLARSDLQAGGAHTLKVGGGHGVLPIPTPGKPNYQEGKRGRARKHL